MQNPKSAANGQTTSVSARVAVAYDGQQILGDVAAYIRRYLVCDDHQLTILTLWSACVHCHHHFSTAPYLHIRSVLPCSGRTLCLDLLCDLSKAETCYTGILAAPLLDRLLYRRSLDRVQSGGDLPVYPVLIDDCHHSFGPSDRQPLVSLLATGAETAAYFCWGEEDFYLFGPKAFAGNSPLPKSLAARCIPINLRRPKPAEKFIRYGSDDDAQPVEPLIERLRGWLKQASSALGQAVRNLPSDLPPTFSPVQIKCAEPLIHIADIAGGSWPTKVRAALVAVFDLADVTSELQMLADLRAIFRDKNNPQYLSTEDLLSQLRSLDSRPWSAWNNKSGRRLAGHLRPFGIVSRRLHPGSGNPFMAYLLKDFHDAWERYLPTLTPALEFEPAEISSDANGNGSRAGTIPDSCTTSCTRIPAIDADSTGMQELQE